MMSQNIATDPHEQWVNQTPATFPPTGSPAGDRFISSLSVALLIFFFVMLRSSAGPFLHPSVSSSENVLHMMFVHDGLTSSTVFCGTLQSS